ncbi:hypothetical protein BVC80_1117g55 [Macleaya cordata]|uniref:Uncharacterized protein n=1 Tax=Macleaya cordata TaxID=56857 RepID=A0A200Q9C7_MACCD|nr:hypothetical protein BVC80_1117g55 [Macleaya cordata]
MAGWDSPVSDPKFVTCQRNKSFTKEEIEAYWRSKKLIDKEEHNLKAITVLPEKSQEITSKKESGSGVFQRSSSLPLTDRRGNLLAVDTKTALEKLIKTNDWWTKSNWAFLNEPPVIATEGHPTYKYASQYHVVASCFKPSSKPEGTHPEIST